MSALDRILLVEDESDIRTVALLALEDLGRFQVLACASAEEALERGPDFAPQLILLDYMMPGMNGRAAFAAFSQLAGLQGVPIVFLTARAQLDELQEYSELGAAAVLIKPFDPLNLAGRVREIWAELDAAPLDGPQPAADDLA